MGKPAGHWHSEQLFLSHKPKFNSNGKSIQSYPKTYQEDQWPHTDSGYVRDRYNAAGHDISFQQRRKRAEGSPFKYSA